jgi:hypothetical protein
MDACVSEVCDFLSHIRPEVLMVSGPCESTKACAGLVQALLVRTIRKLQQEDPSTLIPSSDETQSPET